jgi:ABC-2 type transport system ATP-binding protein
MIEIKQLTKRYGSVCAVEDFDMQVEPARVTGFLGPNGAGKTTTLRVLLGLCRADSGSALIDGVPYAALSLPLRSIGSLLEAGATARSRTGAAHLTWLAQSNRIPRPRVAEVLEMVGLGREGRRQIAGYSLGMMQRLGLAAALLGDPGILVLDEPTNGLDAEGIIWMRRMLSELAREGRTVLVSSHLMSEMAQTADQLVVIGKGRLLADLSTRELVERYTRPRVSVSGEDADRMAALARGQGWSVDQTGARTLDILGAGAAEIGRLASENRIVLTGLTEHGGSLEDAYLKLVATTPTAWAPTGDSAGNPMGDRS